MNILTITIICFSFVSLLYSQDLIVSKEIEQIINSEKYSDEEVSIVAARGKKEDAEHLLELLQKESRDDKTILITKMIHGIIAYRKVKLGSISAISMQSLAGVEIIDYKIEDKKVITYNGKTLSGAVKEVYIKKIQFELGLD